MDKVRKLYTKALNKYENGYIDKAIDICEKIISIDITNKACINFKGLLYYFKGDLQSAASLWKLNYEVNGDEVSKNYLQGIKSDEERFRLYIVGIGLLEKMQFKNALNSFLKCKESDYNCINVDNAIATCYVKLRQYEDAVGYVNSVLILDRNNVIALQNKNELVRFQVKRNKFKHNNLKLVFSLAIIAMIFIMGFTLYRELKFIHMDKDNNIALHNELEIEALNLKPKELNNISNKEKDAPSSEDIKKEAEVQQEFPYNDIVKDLQSKNFYKLYQHVSNWRKYNLNINSKSILNKSEDMLKKEGVQYFYSKGREYYANKDLDKAINYFSKAYTYSKDNYLNEDIVFFLAATYESKNNMEEAITYYIEYDNNFKKGDYSAEVLYKLALIYKDIDINKSKEYGEKLITNYPDSAYNNSIIKSILNSKETVYKK